MNHKRRQHDLGAKRTLTEEQRERKAARGVLIALAVALGAGVIVGLASYIMPRSGLSDNGPQAIIGPVAPTEPSESPVKPEIASVSPFLVGDIMYTVKGHEWVDRGHEHTHHEPGEDTEGHEWFRVILDVKNMSNVEKVLNPGDIYLLPSDTNEEFPGLPGESEMPWVSTLPPGQELTMSVFFDVTDGSILDSTLRLKDPSFTDGLVKRPDSESEYAKSTIEIPLW